MNNNKSVATIDAPEFIDVTQISPMISKCQIKVFYLGKNRNGSFIDKETAVKMADTLRGNPIVAAFRAEKDDFGDHGEVIHIENGEISFSCKTVPYGFVPTDAEVWFQKFVDTDEFGQEIEREYLMTTGYLWTGQYEELNSVISGGKGQSMELDGETLKGHWAYDDKTGYEFFIINDATISKLCILGDDVEPCFEGASVVAAPETDFSHTDNFRYSVKKMLFQLKEALQQEDKGGLNYMENEQVLEVLDEEVEIVNEVVEETEEQIAEADVEVEEEFAAKDDEDKEDDEEDEEDEDKPETKHELEEEPAPAVEEEQVEEEPEHDFQAEIESYKAVIEELQAEVAALREFRLAAENEKKDALIAKYFMLSDADKADVVANKTSYSYEEIEAKLAVAYVNKNASAIFSLEEEEDVVEPIDENPALAFSLDEINNEIYESSILKALRNTKR